MNRPPNPDRGPMAVFAFALVLVSLAACGIAHILAAPWAQRFAEMVR